MSEKKTRITEGLIIGKGPALPPSGVRPGDATKPPQQSATGGTPRKADGSGNGNTGK